MYLVTGGAGFIGSNLVAALTDAGARAVVCDRLGRAGKWQNLAKRELEAIAPPAELDALLGDYRAHLDAVIHLGAVSDTTETDAERLRAANLAPSMALWRWCAAAGVPFVYASSAATYGDGSAGFADSADPAHLARLRPLNPYAWTKQVFDRWVARRLAEGEPAPPQWAGLKFFNVYGPNEAHKGAQASVARHLFDQIRRGETARLFKSHRTGVAHGEQTRDFLWVDDAVAVIRWLLAHAGVSGLFNLGTGRARSFNDLAAAVFAALGRAPEITYVDMPAGLHARYQYHTQADMTRLRAAGYDRDFTPLEAGVRAYVAEYLTQPDPYR